MTITTLGIKRSGRLSRQEGLWQYQNLQVAVSDLMSSDQINLNLCMLSDGKNHILIPCEWAIKNSRPRCHLPKLHIAR
ncbi:hypothetical protein PVAP13_6NG096090 [Panicum virgatum]|uniref:Uncharacterized protein n=1 Tax=Panicum virgatum TaxID=38727 RepID=A0A8T0QV80_PANVG|nr:hypothetical protein PVAP13_6NG096090 [Panicum virgatum]